MEIKETKYNLELTKEEIEIIVKALICECEYRAEQIAELKESKVAEDVQKCCKLKEEYQPYRQLRNDMGHVIGTSFMGMDY